MIKTKCCELLVEQLGVLEAQLKAIKTLTRNMEEISLSSLDLYKVEEDVADVMKQIECLDETIINA